MLSYTYSLHYTVPLHYMKITLHLALNRRFFQFHVWRNIGLLYLSTVKFIFIVVSEEMKTRSFYDWDWKRHCIDHQPNSSSRLVPVRSMQLVPAGRANNPIVTVLLETKSQLQLLLYDCFSWISSVRWRRRWTSSRTTSGKWLKPNQLCQN